MPPNGTCDPASRGLPYNLAALSVANGQVTIEVRFGWDGVSTFATGCEGPLVNGTGAGNGWAVRVTNNDSISWWVRTIGKRGQPRNTQFAPGSVTTFTRNQASSNGYDSISDFDDLTLTTSAA